MSLKFCVRFVAVLVFSGLMAVSLSAQEDHLYNFSVGAGFTEPTGNSSSSLQTGWNVDFRGGVNLTPYFLADLDFQYTRSDLTSSALARAGQPGGYGDVWSLALEPVVRLMPHQRFDAYMLAGAGLYHRGLTFTQPATFTTIACDPFFGYCYPVQVQGSQVVAAYDLYKLGWNAGGGVEYRISDSGARVFAEARYNDMFTSHGNDLTFVPVTFGIRW